MRTVYERLPVTGFTGTRSDTASPHTPPVHCPAARTPRLAQGRAEAAAGSLRPALAGREDEGLERCRLLGAHVEVALALGRLDEARTAAGELTALAGQWQRRCGSESTDCTRGTCSASTTTSRREESPGPAGVEPRMSTVIASARFSVLDRSRIETLGQHIPVTSHDDCLCIWA